MTDLQKVLEKLEETLLVVRQSTPESLSPILLEIRNKVDTHRIDINEIKNTLKDQDLKMEKLTQSVQPAVDAISTANNINRSVKFVAGFILSMGVITGAVTGFWYWLSHHSGGK